MMQLGVRYLQITDASDRAKHGDKNRARARSAFRSFDADNLR